ncbi:MAG: aldehyde dehydrogenase family protein [Candidatus Methanoperedens sp.]|nr:aldehyde dehydrogenase family protein [Candidatus Methanoperedens sp.]MCZ7395225.1 aldehyde dehydrogenase family protein [Candidatus Methanoperedens sp.]
MEECKMLIGGRWVQGENYFEVRNPYTNDVLARVPEASPEDVKSAVAEARRAFDTNRELPAYRRSEILENTSRLIAGDKEDFVRTISLESGKPIKASRKEVERAVLTFRFAAEEAKRIAGETIPMDAAPGSERHFGFYIREPVGVVAALTPFNFPLNLVAHKVAPAIAAGNAVVLKPASAAPLSALKLCRTMTEAGVPAGLLNIVTGKGSTVGEALVSGEVNMVTFTGSPDVGRRIKQLAGMANVTLELGSNSATIIDESADLETAVPRCITGAFSFSGQVCISIQRLYVHRNIYEKFLAEFIPKVEELRIGDPLSEKTDIGPMISEEAARRALAWIQEAQRDGANILTGGRRNGRILEPTVLANLKPDMKIMCLEAFAPVVSVIEFEEFEEAIEMVNNSIFGLQAGVYTQNVANAFKAIKKLNVGGVMINEIPTFRAEHMPYGGVKESGIGREGVRFAVEEMTNIKMVSFNLE